MTLGRDVEIIDRSRSDIRFMPRDLNIPAIGARNSEVWPALRQYLRLAPLPRSRFRRRSIRNGECWVTRQGAR